MTERPVKTFAVIAGGGTGGHVFPAIALADALVSRGKTRSEIRFVGASRGLEATTVPRAGYEIDLLPASGFQRSLSLHSLFRNLRMCICMPVAIVKALLIIRRLRPKVVVSVGGYASVAAVLAAWAWRVPMVAHEQNVKPGLANRLAVRLGASAAIAVEGTELRGALLTGNPVRSCVAAVVRDLDETRPLIGIVGGSLGSKSLNDAALDLFVRWRDRSDRRVHHVAGRSGYAECAARIAEIRQPEDLLSYELVAFDNEIETLYASASVVVCRAGAVTVAELGVAGVPSILVPWPGAAADHQTANAHAMAASGAAAVLTDDELAKGYLEPTIAGLLESPGKLAAMGAVARTTAFPDAAERLAVLVEEVANARS